MTMRKAVFGEPIRAEDIENLPADRGPAAFVRLCGMLIGQALAERFGRSVVPQITERILVPDKAIDAEYTSPPIEGATEAYGLIGPGRTVFQFKYRDIHAQGRASALRSLRGQLRKDFPRGGPVCDRFVLMTNLHLAGTQPHQLRAQLESVPALAGKPIVTWGAAEIALRLNQSPHLRHLFFSSGVFCTLDVAEEDLKAAYASVGWPRFLGRTRELAAIEEFLRDPAARLMQVIGPPYVGKTRLVIEALRAYGARVLWCGDTKDLSLDHFRDLDTSGEGTILVIDGCESRVTRHTMEAAEARRQLKTILVLEGALSEVGSGKLVIGPLELDETGKLVTELLPRAPWREQSWLRETASGLPGLLMHIAALLNEARISTSSPSEDVRRRIGELLEDKYLLLLDSDLRAALSVAALLPVLGVEDEPGKEADAISYAFGLDPEAFRSRLHALEDLGLVRRRGRFVEVIPPRLADHLAAQALAKPLDMIVRLGVVLDDGAFCRFLERFRDLPDAKARHTIEYLLSPTQWFPNLNALVNKARYLEILAPAAPAAALHCLERLLVPLQPTELRDIVSGDARRSVVWTLEDLTLRSITFVGAAHLLFALAEAENESYGNNASGDVVKLFNWQHPEVAAPLAQRVAILQKEAGSAAARRRTLVAQACGAAFGHVSVTLHHAERADLPERPYRPGTWDEVRHYGRSILDVLTSLLGDADPTTNDAAISAVLASFRPFVRYSLTEQGLAEPGLGAFSVMESLGRSVSNARRRERVVTELELLADDLSQRPEPTPAHTEALERTNRLLTILSEGDLKSRLWRWAGPLSWRLRKLVVEVSPEIAHAVKTLASDLVHHPASFEENLDWLTGEEAERRWDLFLAIGREDRERRLLHTLLQHHHNQEWAQAFSAYIVGWAAIDRAQVERLLDDLAASHPELVSGVLRATSSLSYSGSGIDRVLRLLNTGAISHQNAVNEIFPLRWDELAPDDFERLLRGLDDGSPEVRVHLIWPFLIRLTREAPVTPASRDLAWSFLSSTVAMSNVHRGHDWDYLAAELGKSEPTRLLGLIDPLISSRQVAGQSLNLEHELPFVWRTLISADRRGVILMLLRAAMDSATPPQVEWQLEQMLNPAEDTDLLLDFAREHGVNAARTIALVLDAANDGFWDVARRLLAEWGDDDFVRDRLLGQVRSGGYAGSAVPMVTARLEAARRLLCDGDTRVATWARDAVEMLEDWQRRAQREDREEWIWDYRIRRAELEEMVRSSDSPQRLWAVGRLLKDAPVQRVRELLTPDEILKALPRLTELDEVTRRKWTAYARHFIEH